ncbi:MAG: VWA domain-containing protein, partial [Muribaculaceae bacterium]|nr:VWA domain-containing protein [Muribaculaceae bacterium]
MTFAHPHYLWLLLIIIPLTAWYILRQRKQAPWLAVSTTAPYMKLPKSYKQHLRHVAFALRMGVIACVIVVIARPQTRDNWRTSSTEGTDIVLAMDVSTSMLARDFEPNRLEAAKKVASNFVAARESDNVGLVIFAGESFGAVPLTTDRAIIANYIADIKTGLIIDGTAIGDGLANAINRIKDGKAKSKSIILLTDGSNNTGMVAPQTAAEIAKQMDIRVYT